MSPVLSEDYLNERVGLVEDCLLSVNGRVTAGRVLEKSAYFRIEVDRGLQVQERRRLMAVLGRHLCEIYVRPPGVDVTMDVAHDAVSAGGVLGVAVPEMSARETWRPGPDWSKIDTHRFQMSTGARTLPLGVQTWERREPARAASVPSDVGVPFLIALVFGVCGMLLSIPVFVWWGVSVVWLAIDIFSVGVLVFAVAWWLLILDHRKLLWTIETITGRDLDGDGSKGRPSTARPDVVRVEVVEKRGGSSALIRYIDLPFSDRLQELAVAVLRDGVAFSRRALSDIFTQTEYDELARVMIERGMLDEKPGNKRELSSMGRAVLGKFLSESPQGGRG